ncbi:MAG: hypothetical protein KJ831_20795, partial [Candidatus Eisenbacteria bacterium]|nr:hypothetical protein [Candidatus Eisenbacteria bacterium]
RHEPAFYQSMRRALQQSGEWRSEIWNVRKNGLAPLESTPMPGVHNRLQRTALRAAAEPERLGRADDH